MRALGHEASGELARTPELVAQAWCEDLLEGYGIDPAEVLRDSSVVVCAERPSLVVLRALPVTTVCPHHLLPATGEATVMYLPERKAAGFGAIVRALHGITRRLTFQEHAGAEVAHLIVEQLQARGALCHLRLVHGCMVARGARVSGASVESLALAGSFTELGPDRELALAALGSVSTGDRAGDGCPAGGDRSAAGVR